MTTYTLTINVCFTPKNAFKGRYTILKLKSELDNKGMKQARKCQVPREVIQTGKGGQDPLVRGTMSPMPLLVLWQMA